MSTTPTVKWKKYKSWSGCWVEGKTPYVPSDPTRHMERALWLTAQVEGGGTFGAINSYDGAAMSAGLEHKIAVYPRTMTQGSLWPLLREFELYAPCAALDALFITFLQTGCYVDQAGALRSKTDGTLYSGAAIRRLLTPPEGAVPRAGPRWETAKMWAILFHELFSDPATHKVQINSAIHSLVSGNGKDEADAYRAMLGKGDPFALSSVSDMTPEQDLALCVYHSYSVNAPGMGKKRLLAARPWGAPNFPERLIKTLGRTQYGRWADTLDGRSRYDRTRVFAMQSGWWPDSLFTGPGAIMPKNL
jgi:hypothetical protein